jgi:5-formyltetrahydrofolate cyclo-ligase
MPPKPARVISDSAIAAEKRGLRAAAATRRAALAAALPDAGLAVRDHLMAARERLGFGEPGGCAVAAYWPIGDELDIRPAIAALTADGIAVGLPVVAGRGAPLTFRAWRPGEPLGEAGFGLSQPLPDAPVIVPGVLLVPLLAFDAAGFRLGYGAGYYDITLEARSGAGAVAVGVGYAGQRIERVPREPHDRPMQWLLTERGLERAGGDAQP